VIPIPDRIDAQIFGAADGVGEFGVAGVLRV
jgi:hypothetical protein